MVARLARTLQVELVNAEAQRSLHDRPQNPDAIDLTMRGLALLNQTMAKASYHEARDLFEQALTLDPANADALAGAAGSTCQTIFTVGPTSRTCMHGRCSGQTKLFCSIRTKPPRIMSKPRLLMIKVKPNDAASANEVIAEAEATLRADPSFARAYHPMAVGEMLLGRYERSMGDLEQAMRISPRDTLLGAWHMEMGRQLLALRRTDAAVQEGLKAIDLGYRTVLGYAALAAFYAAADKAPEAKAALARGDKIESQILRGVA